MLEAEASVRACCAWLPAVPSASLEHLYLQFVSYSRRVGGRTQLLALSHPCVLLGGELRVNHKPPNSQ